MSVTKNAFVTLLTSDSYLPGVLTTIHSLLDVEGVKQSQTFDTVCLVTPSTVGQDAIKALTRTFDQVVGVETISTTSWQELALLGRKDLSASLTKLHFFRLTQYSKVIFLDADTLILRPVSHLFDTQAPFAAAPDVGWPDAFNSGFMVATPAQETFDGLVKAMGERGSWDGGDQGLLNDFFPHWQRLSFKYNVTPSAYYTYAPAYRRHGADIYVLHFIGERKPWSRLSRDNYVPDAAQTDYYGLVNKWFDVYEHHYGTGPTISVADRVAPPPMSFKSTYTTLPSHASPARTPSPSSSTSAPVTIPGSSKPTEPLWDPSRSSPPRKGAHQMQIPINEHYENAWDHRGPRTPRFEAPKSYPAPPKETHDWYKAVMSTAPSRTAVKPVFPWEETRKQDFPRRAFPQDETAPEPTPAPPTTPPTPAYVPAAEPSSRTFVNAWDAIPGIDRYAKSLAVRTGSRKLSPPQSRPGEDSMGGRTSSLSEPARSDASSRDGDDEDEDESSSAGEREDAIKIKFKKEQRSSAESSNSSSSTASSSSATSTPTSPSKARRPAMSPRSGDHQQLSPFPSQPFTPQSIPSGARSPGGTLRLGPSGAPRLAATSPRLAAQAARNSASIRLTGTGDGPAQVRATRVFSPETDTGVVKQQGLAALQRFVENMEGIEGNNNNGAGPAPGGGGGNGGGRGTGGSQR